MTTKYKVIGIHPRDPVVGEIFEELSVIARDRAERGQQGELLTAIAQLAISACKSFGVPPEAFIENFTLFYENSKERVIQ